LWLPNAASVAHTIILLNSAENCCLFDNQQYPQVKGGTDYADKPIESDGLLADAAQSRVSVAMETHGSYIGKVWLHANNK
jgi:hypothetical protein